MRKAQWSVNLVNERRNVDGNGAALVVLEQVERPAPDDFDAELHLAWRQHLDEQEAVLLHRPDRNVQLVVPTIEDAVVAVLLRDVVWAVEHDNEEAGADMLLCHAGAHLVKAGRQPKRDIANAEQEGARRPASACERTIALNQLEGGAGHRVRAAGAAGALELLNHFSLDDGKADVLHGVHLGNKASVRLPTRFDSLLVKLNFLTNASQGAVAMLCSSQESLNDSMDG